MTSAVKEVARILMRRDGLSENEAMNCVEEFMDYLAHLDANSDLDEVESYFMEELGLEPDYLLPLLMEVDDYV